MVCLLRLGPAQIYDQFNPLSNDLDRFRSPAKVNLISTLISQVDHYPNAYVLLCLLLGGNKRDSEQLTHTILARNTYKLDDVY